MNGCIFNKNSHNSQKIVKLEYEGKKKDVTNIQKLVDIATKIFSYKKL